MADVEYRTLVAEALVEAGIPGDEAHKWCRCLHYQSVADGGSVELGKRILRIEDDYDLPQNRVWYLALPPSIVEATVSSIGENGLHVGDGWKRVVIEKPFGHDLESARKLNETVHRYFEESEVFRIDHYLGKETVRNLLVFRFANSLFERAWNRDHIESVEITVAEDIGLDGRGRYYDGSGAVRDIVQNHITQLLTLIVMEPPVSMSPAAIRAEKIKALRAVPPIVPGDVVAGQVDGYRDLEGVPQSSTTATYVAIVAHVDNWRWQGVPFLLRTGKHMAKRLSRITVRYRKPPVCLFHTDGTCPGHRNQLDITLQPDEGFDLYFDVKEPGDVFAIDQIPLSVRYDDWLGELPDAYHTLLLDVMAGDQTLFVHADEVEESWRIYDAVLDPRDVKPYPVGSGGPSAAGNLAERHGLSWSAL